MNPGPEVSVAVSTFNRATRLESLIACLRRQTLRTDEFEVVVVNNGSTDATASVLKREAGRGGLKLRTIANEVNIGPAAGRNAAWRAARADLVAFTDDDCEPAPTWLEQLLVAARRSPGAAVQGRTAPIERERGLIGPFSRTLSVSGLGPHYQTANMAYPWPVLECLGGFDETFNRIGGEDTDLAWRAIECGTKIVFAEGAEVRHAVHELGPLGALRLAARWSDTMLVFRRHAGMRRQRRFGIFWKQTHALLVLALAGLVLRTRSRPALLLALPYARHLVGYSRSQGAGPALIPYLVLYDLVETCAALRGAVRHRVLVI